VPSPKFHSHEVGLYVERSVKVTVSGTEPVIGEALKFATGAMILNVAVTVVSTFKVMVQVVPVPLQPPPDQPANDDPGLGAAVMVSTVPTLYDAVQTLPQLIPDGELVTVPVPVPALVTVS